MSLDNFPELLRWLDPVDEGKAAEKVEKIRQRIIKIYTNRGSRRAEEVFDETLSRVCEKVPAVAPTYEGDPALYFYAFARNVHSEFLRADAPLVPLNPSGADPEKASEDESREVEARHQCLEQCLGELMPEKRSLIVRFYTGDGQVRIANRKELADELGIDTRALSLRALRIRKELLTCLRPCLKGSGI